MGEYGYARTELDSIMAAKAYSPEERSTLDKEVWAARMDAARPAEAFSLSTLDGKTYTFEPGDGRVAVINFMSPT